MEFFLPLSYDGILTSVLLTLHQNRIEWMWKFNCYTQSILGMRTFPKQYFFNFFIYDYYRSVLKTNLHSPLKVGTSPFCECLYI